LWMRTRTRPVAPVDRAFWEKQGTKDTVGIADAVLDIVHEFDPALTFKYNKAYIGLTKDGRPNIFVYFNPLKKGLLLTIRLKQADDIQEKIDAAGIETLNYDTRWGSYRLRLNSGDPKTHEALLRELIGLAYESRST
jgi:hypothetical protein